MRRVQIRETIISHFEKEEQNFNMGIKTLSPVSYTPLDVYQRQM